MLTICFLPPTPAAAESHFLNWTDPSDNQKIGRFSTIIDVVELETKLGGTQIKAIKYSLNNLHSMESLNSVIPRPCIKFFRNKALPITSKLINGES